MKKRKVKRSRRTKRLVEKLKPRSEKHFGKIVEWRDKMYGA